MNHCHLLIVFSIAVTGVTFAYGDDRPTARDLIIAATTRPWAGDSYPVLPTLSTEIRGRVGNEISGSDVVRNAFQLLDAAKRRNVEWFEAVKVLENEKAIWSLQACLIHPHEDVQISALRALERLRPEEAVPFLLIYADYMSVFEGGSENATIHGIIHESITQTLSAITGIKVELDGQDPEGLKRGIRQWVAWLVKQKKPLNKSLKPTDTRR